MSMYGAVDVDADEMLPLTAKPMGTVPRLVSPDGEVQVTLLRMSRPMAVDVSSVYYWLVQRSWPQLILLWILVHIISNIIFAVLYSLPCFFGYLPSIDTNHPCSFEIAFFFSLEMSFQLGLWAISRRDTYTNVLVTLQQFVVVTLLAVLTALFVRKVETPDSVRSRHACIHSLNAIVTSEPHTRVSFRVALTEPVASASCSAFVYVHRPNPPSAYPEVVEAQLEVEGGLSADNLGVFCPFPLTITHNALAPAAAAAAGVRPSPLAGARLAGVRAMCAEFIVVLTVQYAGANDPTQHRWSYVADDMVEDMRFGPAVGIGPGGEHAVDAARVSALQPL